MENIDRVANVIVNTSLIEAGKFIVTFSDICDELIEGMGEIFAKMVKVEKGTGIKKGLEDMKKEFDIKPDEEFLKTILETKKAIDSKMPEIKALTEKEIDKKTCEKVLSIVGEYDFGLTPIAEKLTDAELLGYIYLSLKESGDKNLNKMLDDLQAILKKFSEKFKQSES